MRLAEPDEVNFAHERLAARVDEDVRAELVCLVDDGVDVVIAQVELVTVLCSPATRAMQVAGARGVEEHGPGNVALVFLARLLLLVPGNEVRLGQKALEQARGDIRVKVGNATDELIPVVALLDGLVEGLALRRKERIGQHLVDGGHHALDARDGILHKVINGLVGRRPLGKFHWSHDAPPTVFPAASYIPR